MTGRSSSGTARGSAQFEALYNFTAGRRSGATGGSPASAASICAGSPPGGVAVSSVYFQRSQCRQVNGHSAPVKNITATSLNAGGASPTRGPAGSSSR